MNNEYYMNLAIKEAKKALKHGDVPVGAIIVLNNKIIAKAHNKKHVKHNALYHAEIIAINKASKRVGDFRLQEATMYVTFEPCLMCVGAILSSRIKKIVYGASDKKFGAINYATNNEFNHACEIVAGVKEKECGLLLTNFFKELRKNK